MIALSVFVSPVTVLLLYHLSTFLESVGGLRSFGRLDSVDQMNIHQKLYDFSNGDDDDNDDVRYSYYYS